MGTAVGARINRIEQLEVYATYSLSDLFSGVLQDTQPPRGDAKGKLKAEELLDQCPQLRIVE
jgi:hypothetical protein